MSAVDRVLGSPPVAWVAERLTGSRLRVIAYHGVENPVALRRQLEWITSHFTPVDDESVAAWATGEGTLPPRPVWLTFDDGQASVVELGLPVLEAMQVPATLFICPGLVEDQEPYWWRVVEVAHECGVLSAGAPGVPELKRMPDGDRRVAVDRARKALAAAGVNVSVEHASMEQLRRWDAAGLGIGNHTWDHPCLHRCSPEEQQSQITRAHEWLASHRTGSPRTFAYPNGDHTHVAEAVLTNLGYAAAVVFDHRTQSVPMSAPLRLSRLRLDSDAPLARVRAILSGVHSAAFHLRERRAAPSSSREALDH